MVTIKQLEVGKKECDCGGAWHCESCNVKSSVIYALKDVLKLIDNMINESCTIESIGVPLIRAEELKERFDFVVCRAVSDLEKLVRWSSRLMKRKQMHAMPNGLICLKGGKVRMEIKALGIVRTDTQCDISKILIDLAGFDAALAGINGNESSAEEKITGITPAVFSFSGRNVLPPCVVFLPTIRLACWTGIFRFDSCIKTISAEIAAAVGTAGDAGRHWPGGCVSGL